MGGGEPSLMVSRRRVLRWGAGLAGSMAVGGCGSPRTADRSSTSDRPTRLRIAYQPALGHRATLMEATGYAAAALEMSMEFTNQPSGPAIVQEFAQGQLDVAYLGPFPALIGIDRGVPIRIVAANHWYGYSLVGRAGMVESVRELGGDRVAAAEQFRGQTVGAFAKGSAQDTVARWFFSQAGMEEGVDYAIRNYSGPEALPLLRSGALSGFVEYFEYVALAVDEDAYVAVIDGEELWPGLDNVVVVRQELLDRHSDLVEEFLRVDADVARFAMSYPEDYARLSAPVLQVAESDAITRITYNTRYCPSPDRAAVDAVFALVPAMRDAGYVTGELTPGQAMDLSIIVRVAGPGGACDGIAQPDDRLYAAITGS